MSQKIIIFVVKKIYIIHKITVDGITEHCVNYNLIL